jgi:hypothetical protein
VILEISFEDWFDYYPARLLDDPISYRRNPQGTLATIRLRYIYAQNRLRFISPRLQIPSYRLKKQRYALTLDFFQSHAVDASTASIGFHFFPSPPQYIGPEYAVIECMESSIPTLLGRQV